jgi:hypothetical protein
MYLNRNIMYARPGDDLLLPALNAAAVTVVDGTLDAAYLLSALSSGTPSAGILCDTDHFAIVIDHGAPVVLQLPVLVHTNLRSNAVGKFQRNATNPAFPWVSPSVDARFVLTDPESDGLRPNPWLDRTIDAAYRYTTLAFSGNGGNNIYIGQIFLSALLRQLTMNIGVLPELTPTFKTIVNPTNTGVNWKTQKGVRIKMLQGAKGVQTVNAFPDLYNWALASQGMALNSILIPDPNVNDAWYVEWNSDTALKYTLADPYGNVQDLAPGWNELSRGSVLQ